MGQGPPNDTVIDSNGILLAPVSQYPSAVYFNVTRSSNVDAMSCDALIDVFNVKIYSDNGIAENFAYFEGTNCKPYFSDTELLNLTDHIYDLIDLSTVDGVTGHFGFNWTTGEYFSSSKVGSFGTYTNYKNGLGLWNFGRPNAISVSVCRIGYVTIMNGIISVQPDKQISRNVLQVQLSGFGNSFLRNTVVPEDSLTQIDLFNPFGASINSTNTTK